jgi:hypothetical protein
VLIVAAVSGCTVAAPNGTEGPATVAAATPSPSPGQKRPAEVDLTINGVRIGTTEAKVRELLGKPTKIEKDVYDGCSSGYLREFRYDGLIVLLLSDENRKNYSVTQMEVTSDKWEIYPGIRTGDAIAKVRATFGAPAEENPAMLYYGVEGNDGWVNFESKNDRLIRAVANVTLC